MKWPSHGSNPHYLYEAMNLPMPAKRIDFSANINPLGPPEKVKQRWNDWFSMVVDYPDPEARQLKLKIAQKEGIDKDQVMVGNGAAELITLIAQVFREKKVLILEPAFTEYEEACLANGCEVDFLYINEENWAFDQESLFSRIAKVDVVFFCNPNNPTGQFFEKEFVTELASRCKEHGTYLLVDEAFYDFVAGYQSLVPLVKENEFVILLRSMTKMFAVPGIRLGYMISAQSFTARVSKLKPHWSVNALALQAGLVCMDEEEFVKKTVNLIDLQRAKLFDFYEQHGFQTSPTTVNFYLLRDQSQRDLVPLFRFLLEHGIVARHTMNFRGIEGRYLRLAIKGEEENDRLMEVIAKWRRTESSFS